MASVPHRVGEERATVPRIVLPLTSRGLAVTDRFCWGVLAVAMAASAGLILYLNRGTVFFVDELTRFLSAPTLDPVDVLEPHAGHLTATSKLVYKGILEAFGADYLAFRLLGVSVVLLSAGLFYALVKRRIGAVPALAPTLVLLFFGSSSQMVVTPLGFNVLFSIAAGLAALLALERDDRRGDVSACALICLSVATLSIGLAFLVGVAISVLLRADRWRRAWIFAVPLVLYVAWWLWASSASESAQEFVKASNVLLIPGYVADSLAAAIGALAGLSYRFGAQAAPGVELGWGRVLAAAAVVALALRIRRGNVPASLWVSLGIVLAFWALGALAVGLARSPEATRYVYTGAVGVLLVATDAARSTRFTRIGLALLFAACAVSLATNIALLRDSAAEFRAGYSAPVRANLAMAELAREYVDPDFNPVADVKALSLGGIPAGPYLAAVDRYGSPAFSLAEVQGQSETVRQGADRVLAEALGLRVTTSPRPLTPEGCRRIQSEAGGPIAFELPVGGARMRARSSAPAPLTVGRFAADPSVKAGAVKPGETGTLQVPPDSSPRPWRASIAGASSVEVCALR